MEHHISHIYYNHVYMLEQPAAVLILPCMYEHTDIRYVVRPMTMLHKKSSMWGQNVYSTKLDIEWVCLVYIVIAILPWHTSFITTYKYVQDVYQYTCEYVQMS